MDSFISYLFGKRAPSTRTPSLRTPSIRSPFSRSKILKIAKIKKFKILKTRQRKVVSRSVLSRKKKSRPDYLAQKENTRKLVHENLIKYSDLYREMGIDIPPYKKVFIKDTVSRWGSCSSKGNLNFSYRLAVIPQHLAEYIVAHELCHLKEFNHSNQFWLLVEKTIPDYEARKEELKKYSLRKVDII